MLGSCVDFGPGLIHWYGLYPVHSLVFAGMLKGIASAAAMRTDATKGRYRRAPAHRARARRSSWSALTRPERSASPVGTPAPSLGHPGRRSRSTFPAKPASPAGYPAGRAPRCRESAGTSFFTEWALAVHRAVRFPLPWLARLEAEAVEVPVGGAARRPAAMQASRRSRNEWAPNGATYAGREDGVATGAGSRGMAGGPPAACYSLSPSLVICLALATTMSRTLAAPPFRSRLSGSFVSSTSVARSTSCL